MHRGQKGCLTCNFALRGRLPIMRTTDSPSSLAFRLPRSRGTTAARPFPPRSFTVAAPRAGTEGILSFTIRLLGDLARAASEGDGAPKASSPLSHASSGNTGGGPHRRTSVRTTVFRATQRCGAGSAAWGRRLNSFGGQEARPQPPGIMLPDDPSPVIVSEISRRFSEFFRKCE